MGFFRILRGSPPPPTIAEMKAAGDVDGLLKALGTDDFARVNEAVAALGELKAAQAAAPLTNMLRKLYVEVEKTWHSWAISRTLTRTLPDFSAFIEKELPHLYPTLGTICTALGQLAYGEAADALYEVAFYEHYTKPVRLKAIEALGKMREGKEPLEALLDGEKDKDIRSAVKKALAGLQNRGPA